MLILLLYEQWTVCTMYGVCDMQCAVCSVQFIHDMPVNYTFVLMRIWSDILTNVRCHVMWCDLWFVANVTNEKKET